MSGLRAGVPGLPVTTSLSRGVPGAFLGDGEAARFVTAFFAAFDAVLAPAVASIEDVDAYLTPATAPADFVQWLAGWVSLEVDQRWSAAELRARVAGAASVYAWIGTVRGLVEGVELMCGVRPTVSEPGEVCWSARPGGTMPGRRGGELVVTVPPGSDVPGVERVVAQLVPAHLSYRVTTAPDRGAGLG